MTWPIYIPSKGRPNSKLIAQLAGLATIVVEPQDVDAYRAVNPAAVLRVLPDNNRGIGFVRNDILDAARGNDCPWFWMLDDDIQAFYRNPGSRKIDFVSDALNEAERLIEPMPNVGQAAIEYQQFAWGAKKKWATNSYCDAVVAINTRRTAGLRYRPEADLKEDRDFTLQVLASGRATMRVQCLGFKSPANGSNAGGLSDAYHREAEAVDTMVRLWPGVVTRQVKPSGRVDCKINWRALRA